MKNDPIIQVEHLKKSFSIKQPTVGFKEFAKAIVFPTYKTVDAICDLSFSIARGEKLAFIGPNGAGKSTTIKMLTGILYPTTGHISVLGLVPWKNRTQLGYKIGTVFGQRTQLWYHLPPRDTFNLLSKIYEIPKHEYVKRLHELSKIFELSPFLDKPVRQLSLGERMRCELVASLLHRPEILFLDEPTIGLDINAKLMIRSLLNRLSQEHGTTLFLTSHDTADIEQICERVMVLDHGKLILDDSLRNLKKNYIQVKKLTLFTDGSPLHFQLPGVSFQERSQYRYVCEVDLTVSSVDQVIQAALPLANLQDITIEDPSMEEIIRGVYAKGAL